MAFVKTAVAAYGSTTLFVLLWSSGAIVSKLGLAHASAFAFLVLRFALASGVLVMLGLWRRRWLPASGTRLRVAITGAFLTGGYPICYLLALDHGLTPGILVTLLGAQPILTLVLVERRLSAPRLGGLLLALGGLSLVVFGAGNAERYPMTGVLFGSASLACMTIGSILQKSLKQQPTDVLPLQNVVSLTLAMLFVPFQPITFVPGLGFLLPLLWLGIGISVFAQLLLYRLMQAGNLVNVTSLFYFVPVVTAVMDYLVLCNRLTPLSLAGMVSILAGLLLAFRAAPASALASAAMRASASSPVRKR
ncbi:EamA-like transporter family protein (plasmid) [Caballeronia sp. SBC1]|uniref:DMT family transporter n=1 Tax=unclassified Caballeronia TaxID=2646786 RepID=UPI0013E171DC|nr:MULTISPECIES: DMT family transporter [unclassified Caballeronia]QIE27194.1 EamA-like transporter family protein [Caballeronia sp. SBC2]QIN65327.1 EamA-like transporter family protein [Caballeronia sp. SBC1]